MISASSKKDDKAVIDERKLTSYMIKLATDFLFVVLPMLLFLTVLAEWTQVAAFCLIVLLVLYLAFKRFHSSSSYSKGGREAAYSVRTVLSSYRVLVMIITCLCILAVDFRIFPRRYGKTETYGTGLALSSKSAFQRHQHWLEHARIRSARHKIMKFLKEQAAMSASDLTAEAISNLLRILRTRRVYSIRDAAANNLKRFAEEFGPEWAM